MLVIRLSIICALLPLVKSTESVRVTTKYGDIEGLVTAYPNASGPFKSVSKFLGVPFAAPPTGKLRLTAPKQPVAWKPNVLQAKEHENMCIQSRIYDFFFKRYAKSFTFNEDCLYLDIYTPDVKMNFSVMVYIHGGGYQAGGALAFPTDILALHGVVVVVIQYRLGPFGFLTTGDSAAPGNFGMLDQVEALKWVKDNIEHFGGNPTKVTIFGDSAGGTSVTLHLLSPLSKGLFHQVIAESGVDLSPFAIQPVSSGLRYAKELAKKLDCTTDDHKAMLACIREKTDLDVQNAAESIPFRYINHPLWTPVVDENFLSDTPRNLRAKGNFKKAKLMISFNSQEGATTLSLIASSLGLNESVDNGVSPSFYNAFVTRLAHARNSRKENADLIADALEFMYTPWPDNSDKYALRSELVDLVGDYPYYAPSHEVADIHSKEAPVYMYEFAHPSNVTWGTKWMGVVHGDNVPYDFGIPLLPNLPFGYSAVDKNVSVFIMTVYANFANYGEPTPQPVSGVTWEKYNSSHRAYLRVDANPKMAAAFYPRRMSFWNDYYPKLEQVKFATKKDVISGASAGTLMSLFRLTVLVATLVML